MKKRFEVVCNEHGIVIKTEDRNDLADLINKVRKEIAEPTIKNLDY